MGPWGRARDVRRTRLPRPDLGAVGGRPCPPGTWKRPPPRRLAETEHMYAIAGTLHDRSIHPCQWSPPVSERRARRRPLVTLCKIKIKKSVVNVGAKSAGQSLRHSSRTS
ncbi:hypothetical protein AcW1_008648 [Taiwanofungus camphoratus]|nr:hypothetical protein AcW1_008648 [Antrodia cinnamomea]